MKQKRGETDHCSSEGWSTAREREKNHSTDRFVLNEETNTREGTVEEKQLEGDGPVKETAKRAEKSCP